MSDLVIDASSLDSGTNGYRRVGCLGSILKLPALSASGR
jgi:hypothetical protein